LFIGLDVKYNENDFNYPIISISFIKQKVYYHGKEGTIVLNKYIDELKGKHLCHFPKYYTNYSQTIECNKTLIFSQQIYKNYYNNTELVLNNKSLLDFSDFNIGYYFNNEFEDYLQVFMNIRVNNSMNQKSIKRDLFMISGNCYKMDAIYIIIHSEETDQFKTSQITDFGTCRYMLSQSSMSFIQKLLIRKISFKYIQNCNNYDSNTSSHTLCKRQCLRKYCKESLSCVPLYQDNYIHHDDFKYYGYNICSINEIDQFEIMRKQYINEKCEKICPKNCFEVKYYWDLKPFEPKFNLTQPSDYKFNFTLTFEWDSNSPMYVYEEQPLLSFQDYLCYCGGLFGLWFGTNAKDFIISIIKRRVWIKILFNIKEFNKYIMNFKNNFIAP